MSITFSLVDLSVDAHSDGLSVLARGRPTWITWLEAAGEGLTRVVGKVSCIAHVP